MKSGSLFKASGMLVGVVACKLFGGHHRQRRGRQGDVGNDARTGDGDRFDIAALLLGAGARRQGHDAGRAHQRELVHFRVFS